MFVNDPMVLELLALLKAHNIRHFVISPGARHYPIVRGLEDDSDFELFSVVDERSAGFFAIGLIKSLDRPVAVVSTSGTAAVNYGSAIAEAYYQRLPLLAITADRLPELLDQMEEQMVDQTRLFLGMTKFKGQLKPVGSELDAWYNNRVLNESLLALTRDGGGPVHLNIPIGRHSGLRYDIPALPNVRVIRRHATTDGEIDWTSIAARIAGKRIMVLWGNGVPVNGQLLESFDQFARVSSSVVLTDHLSNFHHQRAVRRSLELLGSGHARSHEIWPDVVITIGGNMAIIERVKSFLSRFEVEHWRVDPDGNIVDPFRRLTDVFQLSATEFFRELSRVATCDGSDAYARLVEKRAEGVPHPQASFGEFAVIGEFLKELPAESVLHIGNSASIRMAQHFPVDPSVTVFGNRGVNGIDGSMSSAVGYACGTNKLTFLLLGDLSFFYDMNSLWIRHLPTNLRILMINNGGGALMHAAPLTPAAATQGALHISAGHETSARGWVESLGIRHIAVSGAEDFTPALRAFVDSAQEGPLVLEVFTEKVSDMEQLTIHGRLVSRSGEDHPLYRRLRRVMSATLRRLGVR